MPLHIAYRDAIDAERTPVRRMPSRHAEPLPGCCIAILQPRVANVLSSDPGKPGQLPRKPLSVRADFFEIQKVMFAIAVEVIAEFFGNVEISRGAADCCSVQRRSVRAGPVGQRIAISQWLNYREFAVTGTTW